MAKKSLHDTPVLGSLIRELYSFPIRRGVLDTSALKTAVSLLRHNNLVLMFPEGTRSTDGNLQEPRPGVGKIVAESGVPVIPGYVKGSFNAWPKGGQFPKPVKTSVHFGEPVRMDDFVKENMRSDDYKEMSREILDTIKTIKQRVNSTS